MSETPKRRRVIKPGRQAEYRNGVSVSQSRLWDIFAEARILAKEASGDLTVRELYKRPASPAYHQPPGTLSIKLGYFDANGSKVAETHHFELLDGSIGASHRREPKLVVHNGVLYYFPDH
jgi:hypothetical protein